MQRVSGTGGTRETSGASAILHRAPRSLGTGGAIRLAIAATGRRALATRMPSLGGARRGAPIVYLKRALRVSTEPPPLTQLPHSPLTLALLSLSFMQRSPRSQRRNENKSAALSLSLPLIFARGARGARVARKFSPQVQGWPAGAPIASPVIAINVAARIEK